jgi:hypothetical protein
LVSRVMNSNFSTFFILLPVMLVPPARGETIELERHQHGTYEISVRINDSLSVFFTPRKRGETIMTPGISRCYRARAASVLEMFLKLCR